MSSKAERIPTRVDAEPGEHGEHRAHGERGEHGGKAGEHAGYGAQVGYGAQAGYAEQAGHAEQEGTAGVGNVEADREDPGSWRRRFEIAAMARAPREKQWTIPPQADKGPVNITVRLPEVQVDDSDGRHILIGPEQADVLGSRLVGIRDWLQHGHDDWVGDDDKEC